MRKQTFMIIALLTIASSATAQSLTVQDIEAKSGEQTTLTVNLSGATTMTALQFNLTLPEGVTLSESDVTMGAATNGHTLNMQTLDNGDRMFVLYSMNLNTFKNGELLRIPLTAGETATEANGKLYTVRTATADAVSHTCADASFSVKVAAETEFQIVEGATEFSIDEDKFYETITYTRTFKNTGWQALYVPFSMTLSDWEENFEVARISTIFLEDLNGNGVIEPTNSVQPEQKMLIVKIGEAQRGMRLRPNYPYLIKAKRASNTPQTITVHNATLYATAENSYDCSTLENKFTFTGIYHQKKNLDNPRVYYMGGGKVAYTTSSTTALNPFRWYMQMTERDGSLLPAEALPNEIKLVVMDEDGEITSIEGLDGTSIIAQPAREGWWTLSGVKLSGKPTQKGIYIHDGKKVSIQ